MGIASDLRESVLQAAIQGKLTEQLATDGNARDLLKQIKAEKDKLIADKKIKKEKTLAPISDDEKPFEIPDNWEWCYLGDVFSHIAGKALNQKNTVGSKHKYITTSNVYWNHFELDNLKEMYYTDEEVEKYSVVKGDLLILEGGDVGRTAIWDKDESYCIQNHIHRLRPYVAVKVKYFYYMMMFYKTSDKVKGKGISIKGLSANAVHIIPVPLPPLAEQERIVTKVDELMKEIDELEKIENELESIKKVFPADMKSALLQAAMKGELTERLATDGTAKELLDKIGVKPIADTSDMPFDIPDGWEWVQFGDIADFQGGKTPPRAEVEWWSDDYRWVSIADMPENGTLMTTKEGISAKALKDKFGNNVSKKGTLIMSFKLTVGRVSILGIDAVHNEAIISIYPKLGTGNTMRDYFFKILPFVTTFGDSKNAIKGKTLNRNSIYALPIPLPPLPEQERIVAQLDKLLPLCESLS